MILVSFFPFHVDTAIPYGFWFNSREKAPAMPHMAYNRRLRGQREMVKEGGQATSMVREGSKPL